MLFCLLDAPIFRVLKMQNNRTKYGNIQINFQNFVRDSPDEQRKYKNCHQTWRFSKKQINFINIHIYKKLFPLNATPVSLTSELQSFGLQWFCLYQNKTLAVVDTSRFCEKGNIRRYILTSRHSRCLILTRKTERILTSTVRSIHSNTGGIGRRSIAMHIICSITGGCGCCRW
jgi:hypothetical protein